MKLWNYSVLVILSLLLAACGDSSDSEVATAETDAVAEVQVETSGDQSVTMQSNGSIYCGESTMGGEPYYFEVYAMQPPYQLNLRFPRDLQPGTHPIFGSDDPESNSDADGNAYFYWRGDDRVRFDQVENGEFTVESVPAARGEQLVGRISADMSDDDGNHIQLTADLNVDAGSQSFAECP